MEEPTATQDRGKQFEPHLYTYIECAHMLESCMNALLMLLCMHPSHRTLASVGPRAGGGPHERTDRPMSTLPINTDPQSSVLHLEMSIPMPMAPMRALQKIWWTATEKKSKIRSSAYADMAHGTADLQMQGPPLNAQGPFR